MLAYAFLMTLLVGIFIGSNGVVLLARYDEKREQNKADRSFDDHVESAPVRIYDLKGLKP